jgi:hypothetical protein
MLIAAMIVFDRPLEHKSVVTIALPYVGPRFLWSAGAVCWRWDLAFRNIIAPPPPTPDSALVWGIHQVNPHPGEVAPNWLPTVALLFDPFISAPSTSTTPHKPHTDSLTISGLAAPVPPRAPPLVEITIAMTHRGRHRQPPIEPGRLAAGAPRILSSDTPPEEPDRADLARIASVGGTGM